MRAVVVVGVVGLTLLGTVASADGIKQIAAPDHLIAKPLEVGQWVTYRESVDGHEVGTVALRTINRAQCGMQFLAELSGSVTKRWIFCVDDNHQVVKATLDGQLVVLHDHLDELGALLTRVLPPQFAGSFTREDVSVPAGYFHDTERKDGATTTWLHPDVPLGAVVRVRQGEREDVLVGYGVGGPIEELARPRRHRSHVVQFYEIGAGTAYRADTAMSDRFEGFSFALGLHGNERVDPVLWMSGLDNRVHVGSDAERTSTLLALVGVRWHPFGRRVARLQMGIPYVEAGAGYAQIGTGDMSRGDGIAAGARIGWDLTDTGTWAIGVQGEYVVDHTFGDVSGTHQLFDGTFAIRLQLP